MRRKADFEAFMYGECVGRCDANGEPGRELTLRRSSDIGTLLFLGMIEDVRLADEEDDEGMFELFGAGVRGAGGS